MNEPDGFHPDLPGTNADGASETAIFVRSGNPEFVFHDGVQEVRIATAPGDYIFVPPYVPHREENPDRDNPAVTVLARSTQEAIVVICQSCMPSQRVRSRNRRRRRLG